MAPIHGIGGNLFGYGLYADESYRANTRRIIQPNGPRYQEKSRRGKGPAFGQGGRNEAAGSCTSSSAERGSGLSQAYMGGYTSQEMSPILVGF